MKTETMEGRILTFSAKVVRVMIASPSDVGPERAAVSDVIHKWNHVHTEASSMMLLPVGWETDATPEMGAPPQSIINRQILDKCDILVGVFWTRLGTPTEKAPSGTVEEIEEFISKGKKVLLYFSRRPVNPDSLDVQQLARLKQFKEQCRGKGLFQEFDDIPSLREMLHMHLTRTIESYRASIEAGDTRGGASTRGPIGHLPAPTQEVGTTFDQWAGLAANANSDGYWLSVVAHFQAPPRMFGSREKEAVVDSVLHNFPIVKSDVSIEPTRKVISITAPKELDRPKVIARFSDDGVGLLQVRGYESVISLHWILAVAYKAMLLFRDPGLTGVYPNTELFDVQLSLSNWPNGHISTVPWHYDATRSSARDSIRKGISVAETYASKTPSSDWSVVVAFAEAVLAEAGYLRHERWLKTIDPKSLDYSQW